MLSMCVLRIPLWPWLFRKASNNARITELHVHHHIAAVWQPKEPVHAWRPIHKSPPKGKRTCWETKEIYMSLCRCYSEVVIPIVFRLSDTRSSVCLTSRFAARRNRLAVTGITPPSNEHERAYITDVVFRNERLPFPFSFHFRKDKDEKRSILELRNRLCLLCSK